MNAQAAALDSTRLEPAKSPRGWIGWLAGLAGAVALIAAATQVDARVDGWITGVTRPGLDHLAEWLSESAKGQWALLAGLLALGVAWRWRPQWKRAVLIFLIGSTLAGLSSVVLRGAIGRARPSNTVEQGWFGPYHNGRWVCTKNAYNSFPSGHTATAAGCAFALLVIGNSLGWVLVPWMLAVAWSRIYFSAHHFSDTLASVIIGFGCAWLARHWYDRWLARRPRPV